VAILFEKTGLSEILGVELTVIVGAGNWISFALTHPLSSEIVLGLSESSGRIDFAS
jgi:hypothetical protein